MRPILSNRKNTLNTQDFELHGYFVLTRGEKPAAS